MNIQNRTLFIADNLDIMRGIDSETIDLIYLDPPFNTNEEYKAPIGSPAEGAKFKDIWTDEDIREEWHGQIASKHEELYQIIKASETTYDKTMRIYLTAMAVRLFEMQRILKSTGSIYLHCDPTASHYLKLILDNLFDKDNFRSEIIWKRHSSHNDKVFGSIHDVIFYYSSQIIPISDDLRMPIDPTYTHGYNYSDEREEKYGKYASVVLTAPKQSAGEAGKTWKGIDPGNRQWSPPRTGEYAKYIEEHFIPNYTSVKSPHQRLDLLNETNLIHWSDNNNPRLKRYRNAYKGNLPQSIWTDIPPTLGKEKTGYPTQKPLKLLERIIKASSKEGDIIRPILWVCHCLCSSRKVAATMDRY